MRHINPAAAVLATAVALFSSTATTAQTRTVRGGDRAAPKTVSEISKRDWGALSAALVREDWTTAVKISEELLTRLPKENTRKQLAQLRYLHIFSLAGQTNSFMNGGNGRGATQSWLALDSAVKRFTGSEVIVPPRVYESDCTNRVNFVCPVRGNNKALRITSTTKEGDAILSFEHFSFEEDVPASALVGQTVFLGGILEKAEFNQNPEQPWIVRLRFTRSTVSVSTGR